MSILLLEPIAPNLVKQFNERETKLQFDGSVASNYDTKYFSEVGWIELQSNVILDIDNKDEAEKLAKSNILSGGARYYTRELRFGFIEKADGQDIGQYSTTLKVPQPGIESVTVGMKGSLGTIREAKIKFKVHSKEQLEDYQTLYMTPGTGLLLQWGWSNTMPHIMDLWLDFGYDKDDLFLAKRLKAKLEKYDVNGNLDAMYGLVSDFDITSTEDGGWDCETTILGPSIFSVDLMHNVDGKNVSEIVLRHVKKLLVAKQGTADVVNVISVNDAESPTVTTTTTPGSNPTGKPINDANNPARDNAAYQQQQRENRLFASRFASRLSGSAVPPQVTTNTGASAKPRDAHSDVAVENNSYISFELFLNALNDHYPKEFYISTAEPIRATAPTMTIPKPEPKEDIEPYKSFFAQIPQNVSNVWRSLNPDEVLFPGYPTSSPGNNLWSVKNKGKDVIQSLNKNFKLDKDAVDLRGAMLNYNTVVKQVVEGSNGPAEMIRQVLNKMVNASGNLWDLQLLPVGEGYTTLEIVDMTLSSNITPITETALKAEVGGTYTFKPNTKNSIVKNASIRFMLPNSIKQTVAISAGAGQPMSAIGDMSKITSFRKFRGAYGDRFSLKAGNEPTNDTLRMIRERLDDMKLGLQTLKTVKFNQELRPEERNVIVTMIQYARSKQMGKKDSFTNALILPIDISIKIDGIGGLHWGNSFFVSNLPKQYSDGVIFQIKDITHEIDRDGWDTTITGMMRIVPVYGNSK